MTIRTLVLSGGGGRGAFHAGVYTYLEEAGWKPDIIVGTSIGAVNGAAITQGVTAAELQNFWKNATERDIQGYPPGMSGITRWVMNRVLGAALGNTLQKVPRDRSAAAAENFIPAGIARFFVGRWSHLLDTGNLRQTLAAKLGLDESKINSSDRTLIITATNIKTGEQTLFTNQTIIDPDTNTPRTDMKTGVTLQRILASCSIPVVYPWTSDDGGMYWDGALVANTPLGAALDASQDRPTSEPMEVVVVLLSAWFDEKEEKIKKANQHTPRRQQTLPADFLSAAGYALDWTLLASFRERMKLTRAYNKLAEMERELKPEGPHHYRLVNTVVVAPDEHFTLARIIDYDRESSQRLIDSGYAAAAKAFKEQIPASG